MKIGFMQGRLSPLVDGKIQAFPWDHWQAEFSAAQKLGINAMEWTLDQEELYKNPLMSEAGQKEIQSLCEKHDVSIPSLTGDCFMQAPYWKHDGESRVSLQNDLKNIIQSCSNLGIKFIVVPLVDAGSIESAEQEQVLLEYLEEITPFLKACNVQIVFESDLEPQPLKGFIAKLPKDSFGINYDSGNSAALGYDPTEEFSAYGDRVLNVHIKDRLLGDTTVALGTGSTDFDAVFKGLASISYKGNLILQTARANDDNHDGVLDQYSKMVHGWVEQYGL
jgi:hexulose-6-phosphate isomerase